MVCCFAVVFNDINLFCNIRTPYAIVGFCLASVSFRTITVIAFDRFRAFEDGTAKLSLSKQFCYDWQHVGYLEFSGLSPGFYMKE